MANICGDNLYLSLTRIGNDKAITGTSWEASFIMFNDSKSINKRDELGGYCPHRRTHLLSHISSNKEVLKEKAKQKKEKQKKYKKNKRKR